MRYLTLQLNAKLRPLDRGEHYEDPIGDALEAENCGCIDGGGTAIEKSGEVEYCDIEIQLNNDSAECDRQLMEILDRIGIPKGSVLHEGEKKTEIGTLEGLALYINGSDLPDEVYETCDINFVVAELEKRVHGQGQFLSYWEGPKETALYFYGASFEAMKAAMSDFIHEYPLCESSRLVRIA